jgi:hypothetical protein
MKRFSPYPDPNFLQEVLAVDPRFQEIMREIHEAASQLDGVRFTDLQRDAYWYLDDKRSAIEDKELDEIHKGIEAYSAIDHDETGER